MSAAGQIASAALVPVAHIGHWLWIFYVLPVIIVIAGIFWSTRAANRREREEEEEEGKGR
jgi:cytochrome c-type biogenesis protein CcmH/NrfF